MSTVHTSVWNLLCGEIFNILFRAHYMTWRSSMSRRELFCLSQAFHGKLSFTNENSKKYCSLFRRNYAWCKWESSHELSHESSMKFHANNWRNSVTFVSITFAQHCACTCIKNSIIKLYPTMKCQQADYCLGKQFHRSLKLFAYCYKFQVFI